MIFLLLIQGSKKNTQQPKRRGTRGSKNWGKKLGEIES